MGEVRPLVDVVMRGETESQYELRILELQRKYEDDLERHRRRIEELERRLAAQEESDAPEIEHETTRALDRAAEIVCGDRARDYGKPSENHARTARLWEGYLDLPVGTIDARDVCQLNILQKASRDRHCRKRDNVVDQAGFAQNASWVGDKLLNE